MNSKSEYAFKISGSTTLKVFSAKVLPTQTLLPPRKGTKLIGWWFDDDFSNLSGLKIL
jgi:hypothetical protein